jgi:LCP family protein required for cell wall assembly
VTRRRAWLGLLLGPPLCGVLIAGLLFAGWTAIGSPSPAGGAVWLQVTKTGDAHWTGASDQPVFFLALGNDARDDSEPGLGDAIHVIGVNPAQGKATIIDIPRDTEGPNHGKINAYNSLSGLRAQADAISQVIGVPIPYAITANFPGFVGMVDEIGGIDINVPVAVDDEGFSGANFPAGPQHMNGDQALAYSRDRHSFPNGDITRTENQGLVILAALSTLEAKHPTAADTIRLVATLGRHVKLDGVSVVDLFHMARLALTINPANIRNVTIPVTSSSGTNLVPTGDARSLFADFADDGVLESH